ncbi:hypothetical protein DFH06DRAFT_999293 [Mycena polygramma]|nr:hypothetical protein DFH06DRAFT_999293 [Mycena polygramma]
MEENTPPIKSVRAWRRVPVLTIPTIPPPGSIPGYVSAPQTPVTPSPAASISTQPRLRAPKRTKFDKVDDVLSTYGFTNLGDFLATLFHAHRRDEPDPRTPQHQATVTAFLQGSSTFKMADFIDLLYNHPQSRPKKKYPDQVDAAFSPRKPLEEIRFARPCLNAWATRIVGDEAYRRIGHLAKKDDDPDSRTHVRATTNGRNEEALTATWDHMEFTIGDLVERYKRADQLVWYLLECFCAPRVKGKVIIRKRRPHPMIQVAALCSFIISRNAYASGDFALPLGIWHFACQSHIDVKRVYCRLGSTVSDSTARKALNSMSAASLADLQADVQEATADDESEHGKILDNVQEYSRVYEHGIGRENQLKVGTACTAFRFKKYIRGAFNADDHVGRVIKQERQGMTTESIFQSIDWDHLFHISDHHFVRVLVSFTPHLNHFQKEISRRFRDNLAKHPLEPIKTVLQALATNSEREVTSQGMQRALKDFDEQMGIEPEKTKKILSWVRGDGASHATIMGLKRILVTTPNIYESFRNVISTPETWHTKATDLNSCASNHYGPAASKDPSSLSRSSNAANMKRPTDLKKCDFYPTSRSMTLIWEARVLDCWRLVLGIDGDIHAHFEELSANDALPSLDDLLEQASILRERYASQTAYDQSLSKEEYEEAGTREQIPAGSPWAPPSAADVPPPVAPPQDADDGPKIHTEEAEFDGDRVLSNSILFIMEFGWWIELNYAIPEGDVGRIFEILKVFIFTFAGTSNQNYMRYMLDLYALLEFECSPDLKSVLLNNWLMSLRGEFGNHVEGDLLQEWYNRWLEDMVSRRGGDFDDKFYRQTIAPNVNHFLKIKEDIELAFDLKRRSKAHTSPHLRDELNVLLRMYKEEELHLFRSGRSLGHAAVNRFDRGYQRLEGGKLDEFLKHSGEYAVMLEAMEQTRRLLDPEHAPSLDLDIPSPPHTPQSESRSLSPESPEPGSSPNSAASSGSRQSSGSYRSYRSNASRAAADSVEAWDNVDHSDERLTSGSDLAVVVDTETGVMNNDWYDEDEFELSPGMSLEDGPDTDEEDEPEKLDDVDSDDDD